MMGTSLILQVFGQKPETRTSEDFELLAALDSSWGDHEYHNQISR